MIAHIGPYLIDEELAVGGMARVFKGRLRGLGGFEKTLVIKQVRAELASDPAFVAMFVREANTLVSLSHPHIVPVYELFSASGAYFLSMEYVEGATVTQLLSVGPMPPALVAHVGAEVCDALEYAHRSFGILHRDVTPRNIIVDTGGHARLLDFGIAASMTTIDDLVLGSPGYVAPELVLGEALSEATDLFSLGCVLYEALTGERAFAATARGTLAPAPAADHPAIPGALQEMLARTLRREPSARPQSARDVANTLRAYLARHTPHGVLPQMQQLVRDVRESTPPHQAAPSALSAFAEATPSTLFALGVATSEHKSVHTTTLATSPALTALRESAAGVPIPTPPAEGTRKIRERVAVEDRTPVALDTGETPALDAGEPPALDTGETPALDAGAGRRTRRRLGLGVLMAVLAGLAFLALDGGASITSPAPNPSPLPAPNPDEQRPSGARQPVRAATAQRAAPELPDAVREDTPSGREPAAASPPAKSAPGAARNGTEGPSDGSTRTALETRGFAREPRREVPPRGAHADLSINASPWAEVTLDGRPLGETPVRSVRLRPGAHSVLLSCPPLGKQTTVRIQATAGGRGTLLVKLAETPPRVFLDGLREVR